MPTRDPDQGEAVMFVVRLGDGPHMRRWERLPNDADWAQTGSMLNFYVDPTPPTQWSELGRCFAGTEHLSTVAGQRPGGLWVTGSERDAAQ